MVKLSVPAGERSQSKLEFLNTYYKLRRRLVKLLLRDFGVKNTLRDLRVFSRAAKFNEEDKEAFFSLCQKYGIDVEAEFPLWLVEHYRERTLKNLYDLLDSIVFANSIYPSTEKEWEFRRQFQSKAIATCYQLLQTFQAAIDDLPVDANKYMPFVELIQKELELLKGWKKSGNKILQAIKKKTSQ